MLFAALIGLGSFLFFVVQPMVAKTLLPAFGGAASVWTVCLLFFQTALMLGYAYAHGANRTLHLGVVAAGILALGVPVPQFNPAHPSWAILRTLAFTIGLPVMVLASTSPLLQRWSGLALPYRLYALSNAASLGALLAYPFAMEPLVPLSSQWVFWRVGYILFAVLSIPAAWRAREMPHRSAQLTLRVLWLAAPAVSAALLMAVTAQLTQEVAAVPFLWVVPLAVYLISYIVCFEKTGWYRRRLFAILASILIPISCTLAIAGVNIAFWWHLAGHTATLFVCAMLCHGELALARPTPEKLTSYYLAIAVGGAVGGLLVAVVAPQVFSTYAEFPLALAACALLALPGQWVDTAPVKRAAMIGLCLAVVVPITVLTPSGNGAIDARRNFYGILRVTESAGKRTLTHGAITHGSQLLDRPRTPTTYYGFSSAAGRELDEHARGPSGLRVGVVGLGVGTLARYGRTGDTIRFYELNPEVARMARDHFTFLRDSAARVEIVEGDARLQLQQEPDQNFDVLVIDAFSSDAIPVHLLTREAAAIYRRHLAPGGTLLVHISNHTLNLEPVVRGLGASIGYKAQRVDSGSDSTQGTHAATWMTLKSGTPAAHEPSLLWTDNFSSLMPVLAGWHGVRR
ncbi:MAG: fused MFS/spermidine synthase [Bryobacterales bacterium]|nr:fused MFS/spermidine synthase [Bryobacterales bacterium]